MKKITSVCTILLLCLSLMAQRIDRIEPQNWWVGMKHNRVTLLLYGNDISGLQPSVNYPGVKLVKTESVENKNYLFITLEIDPTTKAGSVPLKFSKNSKAIITKNFPILDRENGSATRQSFSQKDAIYLMVPDRFANGDPANDIDPSLLEKTVDRSNIDKRHGGDIKGIMNHLDYIQSLGFTQIWCTPLVENDEPEYSYHGYAATDFYKIDPRFGTNEQFKQLVYDAKKRGMGVIWDVVLNHCGSEYYFIKDLPMKDWVNFSESHTRCNYLKTTLTDRYATEVDKREFTDGWFDHHMADLNQRNPLMATYLIQNSIWWVEYAGISGFREDTYSFADKDFLVTWTKAILEEYPNFNIAGEEMSRTISQVSYWQRDKKNFDGYVSYLQTLMDFALNDNIVSSLNRKDNWASTWKDTYQGLAEDYQFPHPEDQLIFPDNHDLDRFYTRLNKDFDNWKLGIAMYATMRGIPQFFYGTEILMTNENLGSDGDRRSDFPGGWAHDVKDAKTGAGLTGDQNEAKAYLAKLLNWRKTNAVIANGKFIHYAPQMNDVYVYFRYTEDHKIMVLLNKNSEDVKLDLNRYSQMTPNKFRAKDVISDKWINADNNLLVPAKTAMILEIE